jgi:hypothetical protein
VNPGGRRRACRWAVVGGMLAVLHLPVGSSAQASVPESVSKVEAAFLRNFARYVTWPARAFTSERSPWLVCVLGGAHFDDSLEKTFEGRTEQGRAFEVVRASAPEQLPGCQIVYVGYASSAKRRAVLAEFRRRPVLTVGDAPEFLDEGGIVRLLVRDRVEMSVNLDQARAASLAIPTKMLEVSREVIENGALRGAR